MNRLTRVVAQGKHSVTLQLQETEKCAGCTGSCNKPLFNLFAMKKNVFTLSQNHQNYQLNDQNNLMKKKLSLGQLIGIHISEHDLYRFSGLLYLLPLIICIGTLSVGHFIGKWLGFNNDVTAMMGLLLGFGLVYLMMRKDLFSLNLKFRPIVTILDNKGTND